MTALAVDTRRGLEWQEDASCARDVYFTDRPLSEQQPVCNHCPVQTQCLEFGLTQTLRASDTVVFGGKSAAELARISRARRGMPPEQTSNERRPVKSKPRPPSKRKAISAVCVLCGADFEARSRIAIYCSALCRQRAYVANLKRRASA